MTARLRVRAHRVGDAPHAPLPLRPRSRLRKAVRFPQHCGPSRRRGIHRKEAAAAVLLVLRARPLSPPLLAMVQAPCPGSHPHILLPWSVTPWPRVGLQLATRSQSFGSRCGAVGLAGDRSRAVPGPDVRSGRGELGTGAGLSETYLSAHKSTVALRPEGQTLARGPRTHSARHSDLMPRPPHTWKRLQLPTPCRISPKRVRPAGPSRSLRSRLSWSGGWSGTQAVFSSSPEPATLFPRTKRSAQAPRRPELGPEGAPASPHHAAEGRWPCTMEGAKVVSSKRLRIPEVWGTAEAPTPEPVQS